MSNKLEITAADLCAFAKYRSLNISQLQFLDYIHNHIMSRKKEWYNGDDKNQHGMAEEMVSQWVKFYFKEDLPPDLAAFWTDIGKQIDDTRDGENEEFWLSWGGRKPLADDDDDDDYQEDDDYQGDDYDDDDGPLYEDDCKGWDVNHPPHYCVHPSNVEAIEIARHMSFNVGNVFKYVFRGWYGLKGDAVTDLKKAMWYVDDEIVNIRTDTASISNFESNFEQVIEAEEDVELKRLFNCLVGYCRSKNVNYAEEINDLIKQRIDYLEGIANVPDHCC